MAWRGSVEPIERLYGSLPYLLPMSAVVIFGGSLLTQFPLLIFPYTPFIWLYANVLMFPIIPQLGLMGEFVIFLCLFFFVIRNSRISHFIRFNTMQAILLEIILFIVQILFRFIGQILVGLPAISFLVDILANTIFIGISAIFIYAIFRNVQGLYAEIPVISEAAYYQVR